MSEEIFFTLTLSQLFRFDDAEGELLRRVRLAIGPNVPLVVTLDLHANATTAMAMHATALISYKT